LSDRGNEILEPLGRSNTGHFRYFDGTRNMAFKFALVRPADDSKRVGYYGFAWSTLLLGPLAALARRDFGSSFLLMLSEVVVCALVFLSDRNPLLLVARLAVVTFSWALLYNELYTLGLIASGFRFEGSHEVVSALEGQFPAGGRADRVRLLRERSLTLVVLGLGCLQAIVISMPNSPPSLAIDARKSSPTTPLPPAVSPAPEVPKVTPPLPAPSATPAAPVPTPVPRLVDTPRVPAKSAVVVLAEEQRACDAAMGTQFDSDLPNGVRYVVDTSVLSEADIDHAIASCEVARTGPGRRFNTQLGRAYAARAVLLASRGNDADARDDMNKAITQWNAAEAQGSGAAMNFLGAVYKGTFNSPNFSFLQPDYPKALQYWLKGDKAGNLKAARNAGGMLLLGPTDFPGVAQDIKRSRELLAKAINGGDMTAASLYGQALYYGYPPEIGKKEGASGIEYLIRACNAGDPSAKAFFDTEFAKSKKSPLLPTTRPAGC
jgi:hypothetical protein